LASPDLTLDAASTQKLSYLIELRGDDGLAERLAARDELGAHLGGFCRLTLLLFLRLHHRLRDLREGFLRLLVHFSPPPRLAPSASSVRCGVQSSVTVDTFRPETGREPAKSRRFLRHPPSYRVARLMLCVPSGRGSRSSREELSDPIRAQRRRHPLRAQG